MALYLVVAHQTAASPELIDRLREIAASDGEAEFVLLVPATPVRHLLTWVEGDPAEVARTRAREAATALRRAGLTVQDALVGPEDPLEAIEREHAQRGRPYALTVISTLPPGLSRWLGRDLPNRVKSRLGVPVLHIVARSDTSAAPQAAAPPPHAAGSDQALELSALAAWRGRELYCRDGVLGTVKAILYDYVTGEPLWLSFESHPVPFRTLLVPAGAARLEEGRLAVPMTKESVLRQPHVDIGESFSSLTDEEHIYAYFGLPFQQVHDVRVLREGQVVPGQQRNWQNIFERETASGP